MKLTKKDYIYISILLIIPILLVALTVPNKSMFGDLTDWISQHIAIPDYFRSLFLDHHDLFPDYAPHLQSGANIYGFSYYGLFRPDVLISYVFPQIEMVHIIIAYSILLLMIGCVLCYRWLRLKQYEETICFLIALLYLLSSIFFHSHRQIMFVNYMPFLVMTLMAIDGFLTHKRTSFLTFSITLMILHSYYYSVAGIMIGILYYLQQRHTIKVWDPMTWRLLKSILCSVFMCAILLLPTALVILENTKDTQSTNFMELWIPSIHLKGLLYDEYGCGFTLLAWFSILYQLSHKKYQMLSIAFIIAFLFPVAAWLLNATLYARTKILIVLIPIVLLLCAETLSNIKQKAFHFKWYQFLFLLLPLITRNSILYVDGILLLLVLWLFHKQKQNGWLFLYILLPIFIFIQNNPSSIYIKQNVYEEVMHSDKLALIKQANLSQRTADYTNNLYTANQVYDLSQYKTSSYTSTNNTKYNTYLYDIMKNPISIANRVANLDNANIFTQQMLGVKQVITTNKKPVGYHTINKHGNFELVQNNQVMPLVYATNKQISQETFTALSYPYNIECITTNAITKQGKTTFQSHIQKEKVTPTILKKDDALTIESNKDSYHIQANKDSNATIALKRNTQNEILMIDFDIENRNADQTSDISITINQMKNKLSRKNAPYPNGNHHFTYILSSDQAIHTLQIKFSKGSYDINNINIYSLSYDSISSYPNEVTPLHMKDTKGKEVIKGALQVKEDAYLITSLPYQNGYIAYVDGKEVPIEVVNTAFVGFPITQGNHQITIEFHAPGKQMGSYLTLIGCLWFVIHLIHERRTHETNRLIHHYWYSYHIRQLWNLLHFIRYWLAFCQHIRLDHSCHICFLYQSKDCLSKPQ